MVARKVSGELKCVRPALGVRSQTYWPQRDVVSGSQQCAARRLQAGPVACRSTEPGPDQLECVPAKSLVRTPRRRKAVRPSRARPEWSGPELRSATRSRRRDVPVPVGSPAGPLQIGPNGPDAIPEPHRSLAGELLPAVSRELAAVPRRNPPPGPASQWSSLAGQHIPARRDSASAKSVDHWWKRERTAPPGTFSGASVPGQKRYRVLLSERPCFWAFYEACFASFSARKELSYYAAAGVASRASVSR